MDGISGGIAVLFGGGAFAAIAAILSARGGRNKSYDDRRDADLTRLGARNEELESANDSLREEVARLRYRLRSEGFNPDEVMVK